MDLAKSATPRPSSPGVGHASFLEDRDRYLRADGIPAGMSTQPKTWIITGGSCGIGGPWSSG